MFVFEVASGNLLKRINTNYFLGGVAWSSTDLIAVANSVQIDIYNSEFDRIISLEKYTEIKQISWSADGGKLAWYDDSFTLHVTDLVTANILDLAFLGQFSGISWKNDGQAVVSVTLDGRIEIFDVAELFTTAGTPTLTLIPSRTAQISPTPIQ
jgi:WD40 repeat protein